MKHCRSLTLAVAFATLLTESTYALDCVKLPQVEVSLRLKQVGFPMGLLSKVHVRDLKSWGDFTECKPTWFPHATTYIYASQAFPWPKPWEDLSFMVLKFPSVAARDGAMAKPNLHEANAVSNPDDAVFYYLEPNSPRAFRVELWRGQPIE